MKKVILFFIIAQLLTSQGFCKTITVSNDPNSPGQYTNLQTAITAAVAGDVLLVSGSNTDYGTVNIDKKLTLYGQGYDPRKDLAFPTQISYIYIASTASGTMISGFKIIQGVFGYSEFDASSRSNDITISRSYSAGIWVVGMTWVIKNNILGNIIFNFFGEADTVHNIIIQNNILYGTIDGSQNNHNITIANNYFTFGGTGAVITSYNAIVNNNIFYYKSQAVLHTPYTASYNCVYNNNIYFNCDDPNPLQLGVNNNTGSGNLNVDPKFISIDLPGGYDVTRNDNFQLQASSPGKNAGTDGTDIGLHGSSAGMQYPYSGEPAIPQMKTMNMNSFISPSGTLNVKFKAKGNN